MKKSFSLFFCSILCICSGLLNAKLSGSLTEDDIQARISPVGKVNIDGELSNKKSSTPKTKTPEKIYADNCKMCHGIGLAGAPKPNVKKDWEPRLKQGMATVVTKAYNGFKAMPPKGNCLDCSKDDLEMTIKYMVKDL